MAPVRLVFPILIAALGAAASAQKAGGDLPTAPVRNLPSADATMAERYQRLDAGVDGWPSEVFQDAASAQLGALGKLLAHPEELDAAHAAKFAASEYRSRSLCAPAGKVVWSQPSATVTRGAPGEREFRGVEGFAEALKELATGFEGAQSFYSKFKIVGVQLGEREATTVAYFLLEGRTATAARQVDSTWTCRWKLGEPGSAPLLLGVEVSDCEAVAGPAGGKFLFEDATTAAIGATSAWRDQLIYGVDHWCARLDQTLGISMIGHEGIALGDVDGDGLDDLYVCQPGGLPNRLFVQQADGTALERSKEAGVDFLDASRGALLADFDGDGDQDLVVSLGDQLVFLANDGKGRFASAFELIAPATASLAAADVDGDGDLDLYACGYMIPDSEDRVPVPYHDANTGFPNLFLRNLGGFKFSDTTREAGFDQNNRRFSFACAFEDYDNDGDQDLYVANDFGRNNLYRNDAGHFTDVAAQAGVEDVAASMGVTWADYDQDGWMDLYVSDMFSSAGERVTTQKQFKTGLDGEDLALFNRHARGNALFHNLGAGKFADVSVEQRVTMGRWAWGALFMDADNDGRADIYVPNGFVTEEDPLDL